MYLHGTIQTLAVLHATWSELTAETRSRELQALSVQIYTDDACVRVNAVAAAREAKEEFGSNKQQI